MRPSVILKPLISKWQLNAFTVTKLCYENLCDGVYVQYVGTPIKLWTVCLAVLKSWLHCLCNASAELEQGMCAGQADDSISKDRWVTQGRGGPALSNSPSNRAAWAQGCPLGPGLNHHFRIFCGHKALKIHRLHSPHGIRWDPDF